MCGSHQLDDFRIDLIRDGKCLYSIPGSEGTDDRKNGKGYRKPPPFFPHSVFDRVHWTACRESVRIDFPVFQRKRTFGKFESSTEKCRDPHPENCPGTPVINGSRYAGYIADAHGS